jgi:presenilin-like A22 family membrane protease
VSLGIQDIGRDVVKIKSDVSDLCFMAIGLVTLSVINLFLTVYCAVSVYQIKHSPSMNRAVQMEANQ